MFLAALLLLASLSPQASPASRASLASRTPQVSLLAAGDVLLDRGIGKAIAKYGPDYPFKDTRSLVEKADIAVFNLECTLTKRGVPQSKRFTFRADPDLAKTIAKNGFDVAILANNHTQDYGPEGLADTIKAVESAGMLAVGNELKTLTKNGLRVGFLAYADLPESGINELTLNQDIQTAKSQCDTLVLYFHWGVEYATKPTERQRKLAHLSIDAGADLVLGAHPHVLQGEETYKNKLIVYSLGNYIFDSRRLGSNRSAIYTFDLAPHQAQLTKKIPILMKEGRTLRID